MPKHGTVIKFYTVVYVCVHVVGIVNENKSNKLVQAFLCKIGRSKTPTLRETIWKFVLMTE